MVKRLKEPSKKQTSNTNTSLNIEDSDDELNAADDSNLLNTYSILKEPAAKKFKDNEGNENSANTSKSDSPKRNPFKVKAGSSTHLMDLLSPTKITKENSSLIRNQSPVKRIEYPNPSPVKRMDYKKLEKLSKFQRTVISNKQNVISRFFCNSTSISVKTEKNNDEDGNALKTDKTNCTEINKFYRDDDNGMKNVASVSQSQAESQHILYLEMSAAINRTNLDGLERERTPERDDEPLSGSTGTTANSQPIFDEDEIIDETDSLSCSVQEIIPERPLIVIDDDDDDDEEEAQEQYDLQKQASRLISPSLVSKNLNVSFLIFYLCPQCILLH